MTRAVIACAAMASGVAPAAAAAVVREARVLIVFSPGACEVVTRVAVDTAEPAVVEHRLMMDGGGPPEFVVVGAIASRGEIVSRTVRVPVSLTGSGRNEYSVRYRAPLADATAQRCPLLVPGVPTDGVNRAVRIDVEVPAGATVLPGQFPAFSWSDRHGTVTIGHVPSFVRVPYAPPGAPVSWSDRLDIQRTIDVAAIGTLGVATLAWIALRRRRA